MTSLIALGGATLDVIGLNPQDIEATSEGRIPGKATFSGMDYQVTGMGERVTHITATTHPQIFGGMDSVGLLLRYHRQQTPINYLRLGSRYLGEFVGLVIIRSTSLSEDHIHPFTGVGRKVTFDAELLHVGGV